MAAFLSLTSFSSSCNFLFLSASYLSLFSLVWIPFCFSASRSFGILLSYSWSELIFWLIYSTIASNCCSNLLPSKEGSSSLLLYDAVLLRYSSPPLNLAELIVFSRFFSFSIVFNIFLSWLETPFNLLLFYLSKDCLSFYFSWTFCWNLLSLSSMLFLNFSCFCSF